MRQKTFGFPQMVDRSTRKIIISENAKSINECLGILLRTRRGELLGDPEYGCGLIERIFRYEGVIIQDLIRSDILNAIAKYEPRIYLESGDIQIVQEPEAVKIFIQYTIKETGEINEYNMEVTPDDDPRKHSY